MSTSTTNYGILQADPGENVNVEAQINAGFDIIDAELKRVDDVAANHGYVASTSWNSDSATYDNDPEVMLQTVTFTAVAGKRYMIVLDTGWSVTALSTSIIKFRWKAGATVAIGDALVYSRKVRTHTAAAFDHLHLANPGITGLTAGQVTVGVSGICTDVGPVGRFEADADNIGTLTVYDVT